jgi:hypothetical protein
MGYKSKWDGGFRDGMRIFQRLFSPAQGREFFSCRAEFFPLWAGNPRMADVSGQGRGGVHHCLGVPSHAALSGSMGGESRESRLAARRYEKANG